MILARRCLALTCRSKQAHLPQRSLGPSAGHRRPASPMCNMQHNGAQAKGAQMHQVDWSGRCLRDAWQDSC
jgi:hypothetical protein